MAQVSLFKSAPLFHFCPTSLCFFWVAISQSESPLGVEIHERQLHCQVVYVNIKRPPSVPSGAINPLARSRKGLKNALLMKVGWAQLLNQHSCFFTPVRHDQAAEILA
ncbi:hypothetical protein PO909_029077 [Leuciscus waleckii]